MDSVTRLYRGPDPDFFFYGSLMGPDTARFIADISAAEPQLHLHTASIRGSSGRCGGSIRPSVPGPPGTRSRARNRRQIDLIQRYETHRYKPAKCVISVEGDGRMIEDGLMFVWAGDPASNELTDVEFLLEKYQLDFKHDIFRPKA
ncbi:hypothetical protein VSDG_05689 [Cytospora chrysosperma]|uniref:Gamma-glutamylcyclotransferase AIG2-like domain-containing protein n=1 Tax=Cytospora chrysosperma TaxID=252740 RepID=A0A423VTC5_CYTCH|nr:hypothetical protein VSDG_05689 [Valsa sordida]